MQTLRIFVSLALLALFSQYLTAQQDSLSVPGMNEFVVVDEEPRSLNLDSVKVRIGYPQAAADSGISGAVILRILVDPKGRYRQHKVIRAAHPILSNAVEAHVKEILFSPALREGKPVYYWVNIPFNFQLTDLEPEEVPAEVAIRSLSQKLKENPGDYEALLQRGLEYKVLERYDEALADFDASINANPQKNKKKGDNYIMLFYTQLAMGKTYMALGEWGKAEQSLSQAIATAIKTKNPDSTFRSTIPNAYLERGLVYAKRNQPDLANADYDWVLAQAPQYRCLVYSLKYDLSLGQEDYAGVVAALDEIIPCETENQAQTLSLYFNRAYYRYLAGQYEGAIEDFQHTLENSDNYLIKIAAHNYSAKALAGLGRYDEAMARIQSAMDLNVLHPQAYFFKGQILLQKGDARKEACENLRKALNFGLEGPEQAEAEKLVAEQCEE